MSRKPFGGDVGLYPKEPATNLYVILKGRVKILRSSSEGQQQISRSWLSGRDVWELALAGPGAEARRGDEAVALDTTRVAVIRVADFWNAVRRDPSLMQVTIEHLASRLGDSHRQIESLVFDNNHRRLARMLLELSKDAAQAGEPSVRLTHEELAELIGSTREVVTGMMIEFRQQGLIEYKRGDIRPNPIALFQFCTLQAKRRRKRPLLKANTSERIIHPQRRGGPMCPPWFASTHRADT